MKKHAIALCLCLAFAARAEASLVGHWTFDEGQGSTATDTSGGGLTGTLVGPAGWAAGGRFGGALDLRSGGFVDMGDVLNLTGSLTLSAWVNTTSSAGMTPVSNHHATVVAGYILALGNISDGEGGLPGQFHFYKSYPTSPMSAAQLNDGAWHLVTGVYDQATATIAAYVDGNLVGSRSGAIPTTFGASDFLVGGVTDSTGTNVNVYSGLIDDVRVYDHALNATEVAALVTAVPEPANAWLFGAGLLSVITAMRRRASRSDA